jgi:hypothetical protein
MGLFATFLLILGPIVVSHHIHTSPKMSPLTQTLTVTTPRLFLFYSRSYSIPVLCNYVRYGTGSPLAQVSTRHPPTATNKQEIIIVITPTLLRRAWWDVPPIYFLVAVRPPFFRLLILPESHHVDSAFPVCVLPLFFKIIISKFL